MSARPAGGCGTLLDEYAPYVTGACIECGEPVAFDECDVTKPGGPRETVRGRWKCRNQACKFFEPTREQRAVIADSGT